MNVTLTGRINEVLRSVHIIEDHLAGMSRDDFLNDLKTQDAVSARIMAIGEHMGQSAQEIIGPRIVAYFKDLRNLVAHEYFDVEPNQIWHAATKRLPELKEALVKIGNLEQTHDHTQQRADSHKPSMTR